MSKTPAKREKNHNNYMAYRARKKGATVIEKVKRLTVAERDNWTCGICGNVIPENPEDKRLALSLDHIIPLSVGGEHSYKNSQAAHWICNNMKGDSNE